MGGVTQNRVANSTSSALREIPHAKSPRTRKTVVRGGNFTRPRSAPPTVHDARPHGRTSSSRLTRNDGTRSAQKNLPGRSVGRVVACVRMAELRATNPALNAALSS